MYPLDTLSGLECRYGRRQVQRTSRAAKASPAAKVAAAALAEAEAEAKAKVKATSKDRAQNANETLATLCVLAGNCSFGLPRPET